MTGTVYLNFVLRLVKNSIRASSKGDSGGLNSKQTSKSKNNGINFACVLHKNVLFIQYHNNTYAINHRHLDQL